MFKKWKYALCTVISRKYFATSDYSTWLHTLLNWPWSNITLTTMKHTYQEAIKLLSANWHSDKNDFSDLTLTLPIFFSANGRNKGNRMCVNSVEEGILRWSRGKGTESSKVKYFLQTSQLNCSCVLAWNHDTADINHNLFWTRWYFCLELHNACFHLFGSVINDCLSLKLWLCCSKTINAFMCVSSKLLPAVLPCFL